MLQTCVSPEPSSSQAVPSDCLHYGNSQIFGIMFGQAQIFIGKTVLIQKLNYSQNRLENKTQKQKINKFYFIKRSSQNQKKQTDAGQKDHIFISGQNFVRREPNGNKS